MARRNGKKPRKFVFIPCSINMPEEFRGKRGKRGKWELRPKERHVGPLRSRI